MPGSPQPLCPVITFSSALWSPAPSLRSGQLYVLSAPRSACMLCPLPTTVLSAPCLANLSLSVPTLGHPPWTPGPAETCGGFSRYMPERCPGTGRGNSVARNELTSSGVTCSRCVSHLDCECQRAGPSVLFAAPSSVLALKVPWTDGRLATEDGPCWLHAHRSGLPF